MDFSENPYAPPPADVEFAAAELVESEVERVRHQYLSHEASVQSIGTLYYLSGVFMILCCIGVFSVGGAMTLMLGALYAGLGLLSFLVGSGLRKLSPWVRWPVGVLSGIGLLGVPIGTLINLLILYLMFCPKGRVVFSPEYREVIRQTPHIRYRTSLLVKILAAILLMVLALGVIGFLISA